MTTRRHTLILILLVGVFVAHCLYLSVVAEDAFISLRFARHLAAGQGLVWNPGDAPVEGYTNFLWVLLCAGLIAARLDPVVWAPVLGIVAGVLVMVWTWRYARDVYGQSPTVALVPCALVAVSGPVAVWASSGMETALFAWLVTATCFHAARYAAGRTTGAWAAAAFAVAATLTRPEGLLVAAILIALAVATRRSAPGAFVLYAVAMIAYEAWRVSYFGDWLPNTYYAKVVGGGWRLARGLLYTGAFLVYFALPVAPLVWLGRRRPRHPGTVIALAVLIGFGLYVVWVGGDYMAMYRFFAPVVPLLYLLAGRALERVRLRRPAWGAALVAFAVVTTAIHSTPLDRVLFPKPPRQHGHYAGVETERWHSARLALIGRYFRTVAVADRTGDASLATDAIGAVSYYSGLRVYGVHGLVDRDLARSTRAAASGLGLPGHETGGLRYILSREPTYVMIDRTFTRRPGDYPRGLDPDVERVLRDDYEPVSVLLDDERNHERGYFTYFARRRG